MTSSLLSSEPIQGHFAVMEITDGDFHRVEVIGDLTCRIEIVDDEDDKMRGNGLKSPLAHKGVRAVSSEISNAQQD